MMAEHGDIAKQMLQLRVGGADALQARAHVRSNIATRMRDRRPRRARADCCT
jgi:hypothetical protein